jgi:hypothetical protein
MNASAPSRQQNGPRNLLYSLVRVSTYLDIVPFKLPRQLANVVFALLPCREMDELLHHHDLPPPEPHHHHHDIVHQSSDWLMGMYRIWCALTAPVDPLGF